MTNLRQLEEVLTRHFSEWGELDQVSIKPKISSAFIRYKYRANAEFAKIAMAEQALDDNEQLNVRWANEDSNPHTDRLRKERYQDQMLQAVVSKGYSISSSPYDVPKGPSSAEEYALTTSEQQMQYSKNQAHFGSSKETMDELLSKIDSSKDS